MRPRRERRVAPGVGAWRVRLLLRVEADPQVTWAPAIRPRGPAPADPVGESPSVGAPHRKKPRPTSCARAPVAARAGASRSRRGPRTGPCFAERDRAPRDAARRRLAQARQTRRRRRRGTRAELADRSCRRRVRRLGRPAVHEIRDARAVDARRRRPGRAPAGKRPIASFRRPPRGRAENSERLFRVAHRPCPRTSCTAPRTPFGPSPAPHQVVAAEASPPDAAAETRAFEATRAKMPTVARGGARRSTSTAARVFAAIAGAVARGWKPLPDSPPSPALAPLLEAAAAAGIAQDEGAVAARSPASRSSACSRLRAARRLEYAGARTLRRPGGGRRARRALARGPAACPTRLANGRPADSVKSSGRVSPGRSPPSRKKEDGADARSAARRPRASRRRRGPAAHAPPRAAVRPYRLCGRRLDTHAPVRRAALPVSPACRVLRPSARAGRPLLPAGRTCSASWPRSRARRSRRARWTRSPGRTRKSARCGGEAWRD